jgi:hypothetical protein
VGVLNGKQPIAAIRPASDANGIPAPGTRRLLHRLRTNLNRMYATDYVPLDGEHNGDGHPANGESRVPLNVAATGDESDDHR